MVWKRQHHLGSRDGSSREAGRSVPWPGLAGWAAPAAVGGAACPQQSGPGQVLAVGPAVRLPSVCAFSDLFLQPFWQLCELSALPVVNSLSAEFSQETVSVFRIATKN